MQVLEMMDGSLDPLFIAEIKGTLLNLAARAFEAGHVDAALATYEDFVR